MCFLQILDDNMRFQDQLKSLQDYLEILEEKNKELKQQVTSLSARVTKELSCSPCSGTKAPTTGEKCVLCSTKNKTLYQNKMKGPDPWPTFVGAME